MAKRLALLLTVALLSGTTPRMGFPAFAQNRHDNNQRFYNGAQRGVRGGDYGRDRRHYHDDNYRDNQGGIGPGKGALIGGAAGAALGAVFGGGVKGTLITGAAGAGIGAVIGQAAQNNRDQNNYYRR
jgi:outer membrane lipoprotein SlyB